MESSNKFFRSKNEVVVYSCDIEISNSAIVSVIEAEKYTSNRWVETHAMLLILEKLILNHLCQSIKGGVYMPYLDKFMDFPKKATEQEYKV